MSRPVFFEVNMNFALSHLRVFLGLSILSCVLSLVWAGNGQAQTSAQNGGDFSQQLHPSKKLPTDVILVKGAWASASDSVTPLPEGGKVSGNIYSNPYFGLTYTLSPDWVRKYDGPPPSDSGYYVLAQIQPGDTFKGPNRGSVMIAAEDLFFTPTRARNTLELIDFTRNNLQAHYKVAQAPTQVRFAGHSFVRFDYVSPVAGLHWYVLATQIRCHMVQFVFTSRDTKLLERLIRDTSRMKLPDEAGLAAGTGGGDAPVCIQDYAREEHIVAKVDPILTDHRFNPIPVRVIIDKEGKVKHIHFLSAFPDQAKGITDSLMQWRFKPYIRDGRPVEVETGIMFGRTPRPASPPATASAAGG
jgi:hypothetical protein